jgi:hypothetical protein
LYPFRDLLSLTALKKNQILLHALSALPPFVLKKLFASEDYKMRGGTHVKSRLNQAHPLQQQQLNLAYKFLKL